MNRRRTLYLSEMTPEEAAYEGCTYLPQSVKNSAHFILLRISRVSFHSVSCKRKCRVRSSGRFHIPSSLWARLELLEFSRWQVRRSIVTSYHDRCYQQNYTLGTQCVIPYCTTTENEGSPIVSRKEMEFIDIGTTSGEILVERSPELLPDEIARERSPTDYFCNRCSNCTNGNYQ